MLTLHPVVARPAFASTFGFRTQIARDKLRLRQRRLCSSFAAGFLAVVTHRRHSRQRLTRPGRASQMCLLEFDETCRSHHETRLSTFGSAHRTCPSVHLLRRTGGRDHFPDFRRIGTTKRNAEPFSPAQSLFSFLPRWLRPQSYAPYASACVFLADSYGSNPTRWVPSGRKREPASQNTTSRLPSSP